MDFTGNLNPGSLNACELIFTVTTNRRRSTPHVSARTAAQGGCSRLNVGCSSPTFLADSAIRQECARYRC
ncbi:hypothetical protein DOTSEDRAFT_74730 [Dothistroma septosporum NZE10]|uniref:Uncharacterized protein n=1 Tax=Dothistroma septosporum (strain NZE10 / CBS 128990) TaxID=675120 RepID=N1PED1_DOTSN|nr:hypothetical protein DOTSEDRAFT_74730 [Dothistroma septosporum NZE10]